MMGSSLSCINFGRNVTMLRGKGHSIKSLQTQDLLSEDATLSFNF